MPAKPASAAPQAEHEGVQQLDVDAEGADHLAIGGAGADQHAETRAHH